METAFRSRRSGQEQLLPCQHIPRHRHSEAYAAIILSGRYEEAGDEGRWRVDAGDVLIHHSYEAHQNHVAPTGCTLVNLPLPPGFPVRGCVRIKDADAIVRLAAKDLLAAISCLIVQDQEEVRPMEDWPDVLAAALVSSPNADLAEWAARIGIAQSSLSRGFKQVYGIHPSRFGLEAKARRALTMIDGNTHSLADIAQQCGFADQSHMTRTFTRFIGWSPGQWRRQVKHVQ